MSATNTINNEHASVEQIVLRLAQRFYDDGVNPNQDQVDTLLWWEYNIITDEHAMKRESITGPRDRVGIYNSIKWAIASFEQAPAEKGF